jgi:hypothetical protein
MAGSHFPVSFRTVCTGMTIGCAMVGTLSAQPPRGALNSANAGLSGSPATNTNNGPAAGDNGPAVEIQHHQDMRDDVLTRMEQILKARHSNFKTATEQVAARMGKTPATTPETSKLTKELAALANAAKQIVDARKALAQSPDLPLDITKIVAEFDAAVKGLEGLSKDELAADLLRIGLGTVEKTDLVNTKPGNLLPVLLKNFVSQLGVGDLIGVVPGATKQSEAVETPMQTLNKKLEAPATRLKNIK